MKIWKYLFIIFAIIAIAAVISFGQTVKKSISPKFNAKLAKKLGADKLGMRNYVLAILKTGPNDAAIKGKDREEIFKGHFANINRLADAGMLAVAGPFDGVDGWRGLYIFNVETIEDARKLTETDPTIKSGVLVGEYHKWYGSAAMMEVNGIHKTISRSKP